MTTDTTREYLIGRLEAVLDHLRAGNIHMASAKILADISELAQAPSAEPVASAVAWMNSNGFACCATTLKALRTDLTGWTPLYIHPAAPQSMDERAEFEAYVMRVNSEYENPSALLERNSLGGYAVCRIQDSWDGWQARAALDKTGK